MRRFGWLILASWPLAAMGQAPAPITDPILDTLVSTKGEAESARDSFHEAIRKAGGVVEIRAAIAAHHSHLLSLMDRALTLARLHPRESVRLDAAAWVTTLAITDVATSTDNGNDVWERVDAAYHLLTNAPALEDTVILPAIFVSQGLGPRCPEAESFLRAVISRSGSRDLVTLSRYELGSYLAEMARLHDRLAGPISGPELMEELTKVCLDRCRATDGPKLRKEAEALLEQVVRDDADLGLNLGQPAAGELYRIRHLRIGQPAPELVGEGIDGAPIRLSDFRGKVMVFSFWTTSDDLHVKNDLVAAMKGRPFALVGVNGDEDRAKAQEAITKQGITWRSFWAGGADGEIPRKWGVQSWPTTYIIGADGIIRDDQVGAKIAPAALQPLIQAAEDAAR